MLNSNIKIPEYTLQKYVKNNMSKNYKTILKVTGTIESGIIVAAGLAGLAVLGSGILALMKGGEAAVVAAAGIGAEIGAGIGAVVGTLNTVFGEYEGVTGMSFICYKDSEKLTLEALEKSELMKLLNENETLAITPEVMSGLEKYITSTINPNVIGINSEVQAGLLNNYTGSKYTERVSELPNSSLEKYIKKNLIFY
jgi:hypothetical protein